jgi:hypothetical protein
LAIEPTHIIERSGAGWRLQTQRRPSIHPRRRKVDQSGETEAAGKATFDGGFDEFENSLNAIRISEQ